MAEQVELHAKCKICGKDKTYKTKQAFKKCKDKPCRSCSNSISMGGKGNRQIIDGKYECSGCNEKLPLDNFYMKGNKPYSYCKKCHVDSSSNAYKNKYRFSRYNISESEYNKMLKEQDNKCFTCKKELKNPHIDHCHSTGKVRGLLCNKCNKALGLVNDDVEILNNLINYIKRSKSESI